MLDSLRHYWRSNLAVIAAAATCSAVLTGALVVGDSVRSSLRDLTLERLGGIDHALVGESFFPQDLSRRLADGELTSSRLAAVSPAILLRGTVVDPESGVRSSQINVYGIDESLRPFFAEASLILSRLEKADGQFLPSAVINEALRRELGVEVGAQLVVSLARPSDVPRESLLGSTESSDLIQTQRVVLGGVVDDSGLGRFGLQPSQSLPFNLFLRLRDLQRSLDQRDRVNTIFLTVSDPSGGEASDLATVVESSLVLGDLGVELRVDSQFVEVTARDVLMRPQIELAVADWARERNLPLLRVSTYLANSTSPVGSELLLPYSTISAFDPPDAPELGRLLLVDGAQAPALSEGQILVNEWAAEDLELSPLDRVEIEYWEVGERELLIPRRLELEVAGIVALTDLGADRELTPPFPGIHDAENMSEWEPTFPVDLGLIGDRDEEYWDLYRATPKLFVSETLGRRLWGGRFGDLTAIRIAPPDGDAEALAATLEAELPALIEPRSAGLSVLAVKEQGLRAAKGATDFAGLFIGFSLFLIVSAAMLTVLFFRLGVERRAKEVGARLALGFPLAAVRKLLLMEGAVLAGLGSLLGLAAAIGYAALMMLGLRTLWIGATGTRFLTLHVTALSLAIGFVASMLLVVLSIGWSVRRLADLPVTSLLRGSVRPPTGSKAAGRKARRVALAMVALAILLLAGSFFAPQTLAAPIFLGLGAVLLIAGLAAFSLLLGHSSQKVIERPGLGAILRMGWANAALNPGRSLLSVALVASAAFVIVAVGAYGHRLGEQTRDRHSGAGGFTLMAESDVPIYHELNDEDGRAELGFSAEASRLVSSATVMPFRVLPGDDVSCLNLYQPERPRLLGVTDALIERGGFQFQQVRGKVDEPWKLLEERLEDGAIPAIGDFNSVMWILKSGLGKDVEMVDEKGQTIRLRIVGLLRRSIFQSELLVAEDRLLEHFPSRSGYSFFLVDPEPGKESETAEAMEQALGRFGFDTTETAQRLESFQAVENTYLGTFQTLGGLGLLLGTLGLAVILLRNILERASEFAALRAIGFRRKSLAWTVLAENTVVLVAGVAIGALAALIAVSPHLRGGQALVPWGALMVTLLSVLVTGTVACAAAVRQALRSPLLSALRAE